VRIAQQVEGAVKNGVGPRRRHLDGVYKPYFYDRLASTAGRCSATIRILAEKTAHTAPSCPHGRHNDRVNSADADFGRTR